MAINKNVQIILQSSTKTKKIIICIKFRYIRKYIKEILNLGPKKMFVIQKVRYNRKDFYGNEL